MTVSQQTIKLVRRIGAVCLIVGIFPLAWAFAKFETLPNYLRLATFVPFAFGVPLFTVNDYFDGWASLEPRQKGRAIAWLFAPFVVLAATILWYVGAPAAKA